MKKKSKELLVKLMFGLITILGIGLLTFGKKKREKSNLEENSDRDEQLFV